MISLNHEHARAAISNKQIAVGIEGHSCGRVKGAWAHSAVAGREGDCCTPCAAERNLDNLTGGRRRSRRSSIRYVQIAARIVARQPLREDYAGPEIEQAGC